MRSRHVNDRPAHLTSPTTLASRGHGRVGHAVLFELSLTSCQPAAGSLAARLTISSSSIRIRWRDLRAGRRGRADRQMVRKPAGKVPPYEYVDAVAICLRIAVSSGLQEYKYRVCVNNTWDFEVSARQIVSSPSQRATVDVLRPRSCRSTGFLQGGPNALRDPHRRESTEESTGSASPVCRRSEHRALDGARTAGAGRRAAQTTRWPRSSRGTRFCAAGQPARPPRACRRRSSPVPCRCPAVAGGCRGSRPRTGAVGAVSGRPHRHLHLHRGQHQQLRARIGQRRDQAGQ